MNELIQIAEKQIGQEQVQTVGARELHLFLQNKDHFSTWIKDRISQYSFVENQDYMTYSGNSEKGRPAIEYALTLDMAKELAMVERNEKGKQARQYFIACEKKAMETPSPINMSRMDLLKLALQAEEDKLRLETEVARQAPMVKVYEQIADASSSLCLRDTAKTLGVQPKKLNDWMQANGWIHRRLGKSGFVGYQDKIQAGLLVHKSTTIYDTTTNEHRIADQVRVTGKGLTVLAAKMDADFPSTA